MGTLVAPHSFDHKVRCASRHHQLAGSLAAVSDPTQLSVACSTEKQERAWYFSHVSDMRTERVAERV